MGLLITYIFSILGLSLHMVTAIDWAATPFQIDGFAASGYPYKTPTGYLFWVEHNITVSPGRNSIWCYAWQRTHTTDMSIQTITTVPCQEDNTITWSFVKATGGFNFSVAWQYSGRTQQFGSAWIPDNEIQWITENNNAVQKYVGPSSMSLGTREVVVPM